MLWSIFVIAAKDLRQRSRDRSAYIMGLVGPLALVFILNSTLGAVGESTAFSLGLVDADGGDVATGFGELLIDLESEQIVEVSTFPDRAAMETAIADGEPAAGYVLEPGFSDRVRSGEPARIVVVGDPAAALTVDVAESIGSTFAAEIDYVTAAVTTAAAAGAGSDVEQLAGAAQGIEAPIVLSTGETSGRGYDAASYYALSLSVFFVFFTVQFGVLSILDEKENGTLARLRVAPIPAGALLLGKLVSSFVIGTATMVVLAVSTTLIVGAEWGDPLAAGLLIATGVLAAMALAMLVSTVAKTAEQAGAYASIAALVLGLLGGTFFPLRAAPGLLDALSLISPHRWLLSGFRDVSYGEGVADLGTNFGVLVGFIVVAGGAGLLLSGRRLVEP